MNCADFEWELQRRLDAGFVGDDDRIRKHRQTCHVCREAWESAQLLADSIAQWREQLPDVDLVEAVVAAHAESQSPRRDVAAESEIESVACCAERTPRPIERKFDRARAPSWWARKSLLAVASVVALVSISQLVPRGDVELPAKTAPVVVEVQAPDRPPVTSSADVALFHHAGAAYDTLTKSAVGALEELAWIVIPIRLTDRAADLGDPDVGHWMDGLQNQWQPLQESLDEALDFLREAGDTPANSQT